MTSPDQGFVTIRARFPRAQAVFILGEFNNWSTAASPMAQVGSEHWEIRLHASQRPDAPYFFVWEYGKPFGKLVRHESAPSRPVIEAVAG